MNSTTPYEMLKETAKMAYETIVFAIEKHVATIQINRPEAMNTINDTLMQEILAAFDESEKKADVGAVVVTGVPGLFCGGADLKFVQDLVSKNPDDVVQLLKGSRKFFDRIASSPRPTIAAITGRAFGGGLEIALACDFRIAVTDATLGFPEINIGAIPLGGGTQRLSRVVGASKAKQMMMTGEILAAEEALRLGLLNRVVSAEDFANEVKRFADALAEKAPLAIGTIKTLVDSGLEVRLSEGLDLENENVAKIVGSEDCKEGISAYLSKRKPEFKGR